MRLSKIIFILFMLGSLIALLSLAGGSSLLVAYLLVRTLPTVQDPVIFTREFNPDGKKTEDLAISTPGLGFDGGRVVISPLFPYTELRTRYVISAICRGQYKYGKQVVDLSQEGRYINTDSFWNVFWVELGRCGEHTKFFGPYRVLMK